MNQAQADWPTPRFDRPDIGYECVRCSAIVSPNNGDKQAALVIAGATIKVCGECAEYLRGVIQGAA